MIATVRDERGVTHVAIRFPDDADGVLGDAPTDGVVIGALCEDTMDNLLGNGSFTTWTTDEIGERPSDCMSCLVRESRPGPLRSVS